MLGVIGDVGCGFVGFSLYLGFVVVGFGLHWFRWFGVLGLVLGGLGVCFGFWVGFVALVWLFVGLVGLLLVWIGLVFLVGCCGLVGMGWGLGVGLWFD